MKIINELVDLANKANISGQGTPEMVEFRVVANPDNILAIAAAFRDLEQEIMALRKGISCQHQWDTLKLVECGGSYQYCKLCGIKKVAA
ncbi:MAG: hypothetical protein ACJ8LD_19840 [Pantoea agglomerans]